MWLKPLRRRAAGIAVVAAGIAAAGFAQAQLARRGGEFPINTLTDGSQQGSRVVALPDDGFVVVWQTEGSVAARVFDANTQPLGPQMAVNTTPPDVFPAPTVAAGPDGSWLATWCAFMPPDQTGILGRFFDPTGTAGGSPFTILPQGSLGGTTVAATGGSQFVVGWTDDYTYAGLARMVSLSGLGQPFRVAETGNQYELAVASNPDGSYRVVWYGEPIATLEGRGFSGDQPVGDVFSIQPVDSSSHSGPVICTQDTGSFVVAWAADEFDYAIGGISRPVRYRLYDRNAFPLTQPLAVTPEEIDPASGFPTQGSPTLACGPGSDFVVAWDDLTELPYARVRGRTFDDQMTSSDFTIGLINGGGEVSIARLVDNNLLVTWTDCGGAAGCDIFGQRLTFGPPTDCPGDCNRDGRVTIEELVTAVRIALDSGESEAALMKQCLPADVNLDYLVTIDELVLAVSKALAGCP